jgi:EpsI family protein
MTRRAWILTGLVLATLVYTHFLAGVRPVTLRKPLREIPLALGGWEGRAGEMERSVVAIVGVEDYLLRDYRGSSGLPVSVYVGFYEQQAEGDQIHSPKHCLPGSGWRPVQSDVVTLDTPGFNGGKTRANRYVIAKGQARQLVLYWYQSRGRDITNEYAAKVWLVVDSIFRKRSDGALVRLIAPMGPDVPVEAAQEQLIAFAQVFLPELASALPD